MAVWVPEACVVVPYGWERDVEGSSVYYTSPDKKKLTCMEEVMQHLTSPGTCKCGLPCPVDVKKDFNFDPEAIPLPSHYGNLLPIHKRCKTPQRPRPVVKPIRDDENKSDSAKTVSSPTKSTSTRRNMAQFALLPEVRLAKKLKLNPQSNRPGRPAVRQETSPGKRKLPKARDTKKQEQQNIQQRKNRLLSLLKNATTVKKVSPESSASTPSASSPVLSPPVSSSSSSSPFSLTLTLTPASGDSKAYHNLQEILKQAKLFSLSKKNSQANTKSRPSISVDIKKPAAPVQEASTRSGDLSSPEAIVQNATSVFSDAGTGDTGEEQALETSLSSDKSLSSPGTLTSMCENSSLIPPVGSSMGHCVAGGAVASALVKPLTRVDSPHTPPTVSKNQGQPTGTQHAAEPSVNALDHMKPAQSSGTPAITGRTPSADTLHGQGSVFQNHSLQHKDCTKLPTEASSTTENVSPVTNATGPFRVQPLNSGVYPTPTDVSCDTGSQSTLAKDAPSAPAVPFLLDRDEEVEDLLKQLVTDPSTLSDGYEPERMDTDPLNESSFFPTGPGMPQHITPEEFQASSALMELSNTVQLAVPTNSRVTQPFAQPKENSFSDEVTFLGNPKLPGVAELLLSVESEAKKDGPRGPVEAGTFTTTNHSMNNSSYSAGLFTSKQSLSLESSRTFSGEGVNVLRLVADPRTRPPQVIQTVEDLAVPSDSAAPAASCIEAIVEQSSSVSAVDGSTEQDSSVTALETNTEEESNITALETNAEQDSSVTAVETNTEQGSNVPALKNNTDEGVSALETNAEQNSGVTAVDANMEQNSKSALETNAEQCSSAVDTDMEQGSSLPALDTNAEQCVTALDTNMEQDSSVAAIETNTEQGSNVPALDTNTEQHNVDMDFDQPGSISEMDCTSKKDQHPFLDLNKEFSIDSAHPGDSDPPLDMPSQPISAEQAQSNLTPSTEPVYSPRDVTDSLDSFYSALGPLTVDNNRLANPSVTDDHSNAMLPLENANPTVSERGDLESLQAILDASTNAENQHATNDLQQHDHLNTIKDSCYTDVHIEDTEDPLCTDVEGTLETQPANAEDRLNSPTGKGSPKTVSPHVDLDTPQDNTTRPKCSSFSNGGSLEDICNYENTQSSQVLSSCDQGLPTGPQTTQDLSPDGSPPKATPQTFPTPLSELTPQRSPTPLSESAPQSSPTTPLSESTPQRSPTPLSESAPQRSPTPLSELASPAFSPLSEAAPQTPCTGFQSEMTPKTINFSPDLLSTTPKTSSDDDYLSEQSLDCDPLISDIPGISDPGKNSLPVQPMDTFQSSDPPISEISRTADPPTELPVEHEANEDSSTTRTVSPAAVLKSDPPTLETPEASAPPSPVELPTTVLKSDPPTLETPEASAPAEPKDTVVEQFNDDDRSSRSAIVTSSAQYCNGTPVSSIAVSSPMTSIHDDGAESLLSASHSSTMSFKSAMSGASSESATKKASTDDEIMQNKTSTGEITQDKTGTEDGGSLDSKNSSILDSSTASREATAETDREVVGESHQSVAKTNGHHSSLSTDDVVPSRKHKFKWPDFKKSYPTRSKFRSKSTESDTLSVPETTPTSSGGKSTRSILGKRGSSVSSDLKSPVSECSSVVDSLFEGEAPRAKKQKKGSGSTPRGRRPASLTVSIPRPSTGDFPQEVAHCDLLGTLCVGDVVWAKGSQLPAWPGRIISPHERANMAVPPKNKVWVEWFDGSSSISMVELSTVKPLEEGIVKSKLVTSKKKSKKLEVAIAEARKAFQAQKKAKESS